jgi:hypothetical protein
MAFAVDGLLHSNRSCRAILAADGGRQPGGSSSAYIWHEQSERNNNQVEQIIITHTAVLNVASNQAARL